MPDKAGDSIYSLYREILGSEFDSLHPHVQRAHITPLTAVGSVDVTHGESRMAKFFIRALRLPNAGLAQTVELEVEASPNALIWSRTIGQTPLQTRQFRRDLLLVEASAVGSVAFALRAKDGALFYEQRSASFKSLSLPRSLAPQVSGVVSPTADGWTVEVTITWRGQMICRYEGPMREQ